MCRFGEKNRSGRIAGVRVGCARRGGTMPDKLSRKLLKPCLFLVLPLGTLVLGSGCSKKSEPTPAASETASAAPPPSPSTQPSNVAPALPPQILGARLAAEA